MQFVPNLTFCTVSLFNQIMTLQIAIHDDILEMIFFYVNLDTWNPSNILQYNNQIYFQCEMILDLGIL